MNPWIIVGALVACIACWFGGTRTGHNRAEAEYTVKLTEARDAALIAQNKAVEAARTQERAAVLEQTAIAARATARADELGRAADAARASADSLRKRVTDLLAAAARQRPADPAAPASGPAAADTDLLLAGLLDKSLERNRQLAAFADDAHNRGAACEKSYDAVRDALNGAPALPEPPKPQ